MARQKHSKFARGCRAVKAKAGFAGVTPDLQGDVMLVPAPKLRRMLGISAPTLWRWRTDPDAGFPPATTINGRNYFPRRAIEVWLAKRQRQAA